MKSFNFNQMRSMFGHLILVLMMVEEIVENKHLDAEVIPLVEQMEEHSIMLYNSCKLLNLIYTYIYLRPIEN